MLSTIKKIVERLNDSTNYNDISFYKTILDQINLNIECSISLMTESDKEKLAVLIRQKIDELSHQINMYKKSNFNVEEVALLTTVLDKLKRYESILSDNIIITNPKLSEYQASLLDELKLQFISNSSIIYKHKDRILCNYSLIDKIIEIDSNPFVSRELERYNSISLSIKETEKSLWEKQYLLEKFKSILPLSNLITLYRQYIIDYYGLLFEYQRINKERKRVFIDQLQRNRLLGNNGNNKIKILGQRLAILSNEIKDILKKIDMLISNLDDDELKRIFKYNMEILITLDKLPDEYNPFSKNNLDYSFSNLIDNYNYYDMLYFIGCNIHNFNEENISDVIKYLESMIDLLENRLEYLSRCKNKELRGMSKDSLSIVFNNYGLIDTYFKLKESTSRRVSSLALIYGINALNKKYYSFDEIKEIIKSSEKYLGYDNIFIQSLQIERKNPLSN